VRTLKLTVEYDGTEFSGYQRQGQGERTVQSVLEETLKRLVPREDITLYGAGRTDIGVHALGQVVSLQTESSLPLERWAIALNSLLPPDAAIAKAEEAAPQFHARFSAKQRTYGYLDVDLMRQAAQPLVGVHDFAAFARYGGNPGRTTVRDLSRLSVRRVPNGLLVTATANGFLRTMVRNLVGGLIAVGSGKAQIETLEEILATRDRVLNPIAPAAPQGLCLLRVDY
jgi:tRNA pseudouridine38-40 synthase